MNKGASTKQVILTAISAAAVVVMCVFIFVMSDFPADESTELSMGVVWHIVGFIVPGYDQMSAAEQLHWQEMLDHPVRKTAHFLEYALLGALMMNLAFQVARLRTSGNAGAAQGENEPNAVPLRKLGLIAWALTTAYSATDEVHQVFVPGRAGMVTDVLIDATGALLGVAVVALIAKRFMMRRSQTQR